MKKEKFKKKEKRKVLWVIWVILTLLVLLAINSNPIWGIIGTIIGYFFAQECYDMARAINKNTDIAFFIGFVIPVLGFIFYWILYENYTKNQKK